MGDKITILSSTTESTPFGNIPEQFDFVVGSVFHSGIYEFDSNFILINAESSPDFLIKQGANKNIELNEKNNNINFRIFLIVTNLIQE